MSFCKSEMLGESAEILGCQRSTIDSGVWIYPSSKQGYPDIRITGISFGYPLDASKNLEKKNPCCAACA